MTVATITISIFQTFLELLSMAIILVIIYMFFRLATNGEGLGGLSKLFGNGDGDERSRRERTPRTRTPGPNENDTPPDREEDEDLTDGTDTEGNEQALAARGLDNEHPGLVRILVTDVDNNPLPRSRVTIRALDMPLWRRITHIHGREFRVWSGLTGPDGTAPPQTNLRIGSGPARVAARVGAHFGSTDTVIVPSDGEVQVIQVQIDRAANAREHFEPFIEDIHAENGEWLVMIGRVD